MAVRNVALRDLNSRDESALKEETGPLLLGGEDPGTDCLSDARTWVDIYGRLVAFNEFRLARERVDDRGLREDQRDVAPPDPPASQLADLRDRLDFWKQKHRHLAPVDLDEQRRVLSGTSATMAMTRRQVELLKFLLDRPGEFQSAATLVAGAWLNPRLAHAQVRSYIVKLRRLLAATGTPCSIEGRTGLGYCVVFDPVL